MWKSEVSKYQRERKGELQALHYLVSFINVEPPYKK